MTAFIVILFIIAFGCFFLAYMGHEEETKQKNSRSEQLNNVTDGIEYNKSFITKDVNHGILFSDKNKELTLLKHSGGTFVTDTINYKDILQVEIIQDSESITQTARGSQIAGTVIGGLALGGAGAIIGGLSGKKSHKEVVKNIELQLIINDTNNPIRKINFTKDMIGEEKTTSPRYKKDYERVYKWFKLVEVLIHQADQDDKKQELTAE